MIRTALWFFVAGVLLAIIIETSWRMAGYSPTGYAVERVARILWPSCVFKMALSGDSEPGVQVAAIYGLSFAANGVLYGLIGLVVGFVKKLLSRLP